MKTRNSPRPRPAASRKRDLQARRALKARVRHSRPIHHRFLLHPATGMMVLAAGVLIAGWTFRAAADSYTVTGKIPAPPLTDGATITSPADGSTTAVTPIDIGGSCPDNSYVNLTRN